MMGGGPHGGRKGQMKNETSKQFKATWKKIIKYSKAFLPAIIVSLIAVSGATILQIIGPDKISELTDVIGKGMPVFSGNVIIAPPGIIEMSEVKAIGITLLIFYGISMILSIIQNYIMSTVSQKISHLMRKDISRKINKLPLKYFDGTSHGDTISIVTNDVDTIGQALNQSVATFVGAIVMLIGALVMMFKTNWILALVAIISSLFGFFIMGFIMSKSQKYFMAQQQGIGDLNGFVEENYSNHNVVKVYNGSEKAITEFKKLNNNLYNSAWKSQFMAGLMMPLMGFIGNFGYVAVSVVGAVLAFDGKITFGVVIAFVMYVRLFTQPLSQIAQATNSFQRTAAAGERVFNLLEEVELEDESSKVEAIQNTKGEVVFENVKFGYVENETIIHDFSTKIKPGQKVAIVGPTGAGKTTIVNLLMRFYEVESGKIKIDGISTKDVTRENVHDQFCMVLQDTWLYEGTILENIIYSEKNVSEEEVVEACKKLGLDHFIRTLPNGYHTVLTDKSSLSEGQKQIVTIARAMIKNSPLLILDEATSSVDTRTEIIIQKAMDELMKGRTSFIIAHRLSTIKNADVILVMKNGDIIESGNHDKLIEEKGFYAELYNSQFEMA